MDFPWDTVVFNLMFVLVVILHEGQTVTVRVNASFEEALNALLNGYDHRVPPKPQNDDPIINTVQMYIISMDSISDSTMDYSMSIFLRQQWYDSRLVHNDTDFLEIDTSVMGSIWAPDLYFISEKKAAFHHITVPNKFLHIYPDGKIIYSIRISGTYGCDMSLQKYPLDDQTCVLEMESYGYSAKTMLFRWATAPVETTPNLKLPQFKFGELNAYTCDRKYSGILYTCIGLNFKLTREYGFYLIQVYVPSIMTVLLSWVSFWINADATPARTTLGLVTVLTISTQSAGMYSNLPRVSYVKAIDIWYGTCLAFVVVAFLEFAWVNVLARVTKRKQSTVTEIKKEDSCLDMEIKDFQGIKETPNSETLAVACALNTHDVYTCSKAKETGTDMLVVDLETVAKQPVANPQSVEEANTDTLVDLETVANQPVTRPQSAKYIRQCYDTIDFANSRPLTSYLRDATPAQNMIPNLRNRIQPVKIMAHNSTDVNINDENGMEKAKSNIILNKMKKVARAEKARIVDKASRVIFPFSFILFNAVYWTYYMLWIP